MYRLPLLLCLLGALAPASARGADPVAPFTLPDPRSGRPVRLADAAGKPVVVVFLGTECPVNNAYLPRLAELHRDYSAKGVTFVGINANRQDTPARVAEHARKYAIPFPVLKDEGNAVADRLGAKRTPEVLVLDAGHCLVYRGRIDDQIGVGFRRGTASRRDLVEALDDVLANRPVRVAATEPAGCVIGRDVPPRPDGAVTFTGQVARILQNRCQECHRADAIGPMALTTYDDARSWSGMIREVVSDGRMPPWHADPRYGSWSNDRRLSTEDRTALLAWVDAGCPKGDDRDLPPPKTFPTGWQIGTPDRIIDMGRDFSVSAETPKGGVPYQYITVDPGFTEDQWVTHAEARAGATSVVHHILVFINPPGTRFLPTGPGGRVLCGTAPGDMPIILPPGTAKRIPAGSKLIFQMHYTPNGKAATDRSSIGLKFARGKVEHEVVTMPIENLGIAIPPGAENYEAKAERTIRRDAVLLNFMPHMHLRGKDFRYEAVHPDGRVETLLLVPRYDFNWQSAYRLSKPLPLAAGTKIRCTAHYDNSAKNANNPDPTAAVFWGDQTWQEMMIGWYDIYYPRK